APLAPALPPPPLPPLPPLLPPLPPAPAVPPVGPGVGPPLPPGATAWVSELPADTFRTDVSPVISANRASASRTPYGALVWLPFVSSALHAISSSPSSCVKLVFGVPAGHPGSGIGTSLPPSLSVVELWLTLDEPPAHALLSELLWRASRTGLPPAVTVAAFASP